MSPRRLEGVPWHPSSLKMKENDTRRHKSRCIYYNKKTEICNTLKSYYGFRTCGGSRHCAGYEERVVEEESIERNTESSKYLSREKIRNTIDKKKSVEKNICEKGDIVIAASIDDPNTKKTYYLVENEKGKETLALQACYGKKRNETFIIKGKKYKILNIKGMLK
ncbi:MAG: hypothetical protein Q4Q07_08350 [Tissierellia bacterium]|nr:hypothetical protein [Tissierellia bacterium]